MKTTHPYLDLRAYFKEDRIYAHHYYFIDENKKKNTERLKFSQSLKRARRVSTLCQRLG